LDFMNFEHSVPALNHIKVCMHRYGMCMPVWYIHYKIWLGLRGIYTYTYKCVSPFAFDLPVFACFSSRNWLYPANFDSDCSDFIWDIFRISASILSTCSSLFSPSSHTFFQRRNHLISGDKFVPHTTGLWQGCTNQAVLIQFSNRLSFWKPVVQLQCSGFQISATQPSWAG
jgi:hypothetical protein